MSIRELRSVVLLLVVAALGACSDSGTTPEEPVTDPVYIYSGLGIAGYGEIGNVPSKTELYWPVDVYFSPENEPYIVDWNNHRVIKVNDSGRYELVVGYAEGDFGDPCPSPSTPCEDIVATLAKLNHPTSVAFDPASGDMILCAWHNSEIMRLDRNTGLMDRICGTGARSFNGDNRTAVSALVDLPVSAVFNSAGELVFSDQANMIVRKIDAAGMITTIAGKPPVPGVDDQGLPKLNYQFGFTGNEGPATEALLSFDRGQVADPGSKLCYDGFGNLYICDTRNHCVRYVDPSGVIHQFAGVGPYNINTESTYGGDGGPAVQAKLLFPRDVAADAEGNIYIADTGNNVIRKVDSSGIISTVVGHRRAFGAPPLSPNQVLAENGKSARKISLTSPYGIEVDWKGRLWIADTNNNVIRVFDPNQ
ncbi:MAG TPA: hypothetical protein VN852_07075 [Candidatus Krumholzibacteria bacterium]|nr:hypothetical protein [Candidatus Krumholzibacteria bacterium]